MRDFDRALPFVLRMEGGYVNDPVDRGGATNFGVIQVTYDAWRKNQGLPTRPVRNIATDEVHAIYESYWRGACCDKMLWPLNLVAFDLAINSGQTTSKRMVQSVAGTTIDGQWGPKTQTAIDRQHPKTLAINLLWARVDRYYRISTGAQVKFLRGWLRRLLHLRREM